MSTNEKVRAFISREIAPNRSLESLTDDLALIDEHVVDSLGIFDIVGFLEREFGMEVLDEDLVPENFGSIQRISTYVEGRRP